MMKPEPEPGAGAPPVQDAVFTLQAEAIDWREVEGEVVALSRTDSTYLSINPSGAALWPALERGATIDDLVQILVERFEVEPSTARADVEAFIRVLGERGLIKR